MICFGGVGLGVIFGDVHSLRIADPASFYVSGVSGPAASYTVSSAGGEEGGRRRRRRRVVWEQVLVSGEAPEAR